SVLEVGMGYTSPFLAKALRDNLAAFQAEKAALVRKTEPYLADVAKLDRLNAEARSEPLRPVPQAIGLNAIYRTKSTQLRERRMAWMAEDPSFARPGYYLSEYVPRLHCVDIRSQATESVQEVLRALGLSDLVKTHYGDFWTYDFSKLDPGVLPFDIIWV